jgi:hypothetical protein
VNVYGRPKAVGLKAFSSARERRAVKANSVVGKRVGLSYSKPSQSSERIKVGYTRQSTREQRSCQIYRLGNGYSNGFKRASGLGGSAVGRRYRFPLISGPIFNFPSTPGELDAYLV